jgi:hypothetical protein
LRIEHLRLAFPGARRHPACSVNRYLDEGAPPFREEDDVSWKQPFVWKRSGRYIKTIRRFRVPAVTRLARSHRTAAIAIVVLAILVMVVPSGMRQRSANTGSKQTLAERETKQVAVPREAKRATRPAPSIPAEQPKSEAVAAASTTLVTITGCLERSNEIFRLKDTSGAEAPRSRTWKTAFLKKRSSSLDVVDASNQLTMDNYVGQRISLTGTIVDREMHARVVQPVAPSCASAKSVKSDAL